MICRSKLSLILFLASLAMQSYGFIWIPIPGTKKLNPEFSLDAQKVFSKKKADDCACVIYGKKADELPFSEKIDCTVVEEIKNIKNSDYNSDYKSACNSDYHDEMKIRQNHGLFVRSVFVLRWYDFKGKTGVASTQFFTEEHSYSQKVLTPLASGLIMSGLAAVGGAYFWFKK